MLIEKKKAGFKRDDLTIDIAIKTRQINQQQL